MFGSSKPVVLGHYAHRRSRARVPGWLVLLVSGIVVGAAGVWVVQERYLPPRLSPAESAALRAALEDATAGRRQAERQVSELGHALEQANADRQRLAGEATVSRDQAERLREDVTALVDALPPDPRDGDVAVRVARFLLRDGQLAYDLVLTRERAASRPFSGVLQFVVAGDAPKGSDNTVALDPVALSVGRHEVLRGSLPLPDGFKPKQVTVKVLDKPDGKLQGLRVLFVSRDAATS